MRDFLQCTQDMVLKSNISVEQAVEALGCDENGKPLKSQWTLYKEINPEDPTAKLGVVTLLQLMMIYKNYEPLRIMANKAGYKLVPLAGSPDGENKHHESLQMLNACNALAEAAVSGASPRRLVELKAKLDKEADDVLLRAEQEEKA